MQSSYPLPVPKPIIGAPFGYDSLGTPVPAPLWNPDGTPYVHGVSELPDVPANLRKPIALTDPIAREIVNQEFAAAEITSISLFLQRLALRVFSFKLSAEIKCLKQSSWANHRAVLNYLSETL